MNQTFIFKQIPVTFLQLCFLYEVAPKKGYRDQVHVLRTMLDYSIGSQMHLEMYFDLVRLPE